MSRMLSAAPIRQARANDLDALLDLYAQLASTERHAATPRERHAFAELLSAPVVCLLVAEREGVVRGTVTCVAVPNLTHGAQPWAQIENMVVDQGHRGRGIGAALLHEAMVHARGLGCYKVQLQSANSRPDAHRFYEREGFAPSSKGFRYYLDDGASG